VVKDNNEAKAFQHCCTVRPVSYLNQHAAHQAQGCTTLCSWCYPRQGHCCSDLI